jgi:CheY-like chemotaxis protein
VKRQIDLEKELLYLGLLDKAKEIYSELGDRAVLSYIRSSYRLLSKVYHPDLNPDNRITAELTQQRLNRLSRLLSQTSDEVLIDLITKGIKNQAARKKKILVVEDEVGLQQLFRDILVIEGYDVKVAGDGAKGYEVYCQFRSDMIFTDVVMPRMSGMELVRKVRELEPRIKVIFVSGFFGIEQLKQELDAEILRYGYGILSKPFKISEMLDVVGNYLRGFANEPRSVNLYA